jgi:hypothetical protein
MPNQDISDKTPRNQAPQFNAACPGLLSAVCSGSHLADQSRGRPFNQAPGINPWISVSRSIMLGMDKVQLGFRSFKTE